MGLVSYTTVIPLPMLPAWLGVCQALWTLELTLVESGWGCEQVMEGNGSPQCRGVLKVLNKPSREQKVSLLIIESELTVRLVRMS